MKYHNKNIMHVKKIVLAVKNLPLMKEFYLNVLGFIILKEDHNHVVYSANGEDSILELIKLDDAVINLNTFGLYHVAYLLPQRKDLASFVYHLSQLGIQFGAGDHIVSEAIYFEDPEGNGIEVYADRDDSTWTWQENLVEMATLPVDFESLLKEKLYNFTQIPQDTVVGHIHLSVKDIQKNKEFYVDKLGFSIVSKLQNSAYFVSDNDYHHHIAFNTWQSFNKTRASKNNTGLKTIVLNMKKPNVNEISLIDPNGIEIIFE